MKSFKFTFILALFISAIAWSAMKSISPNRSEAVDNSATVTENIRLYSNGKLIGEWKGVGRGSMDGDTYRFKTESGAFSRQFRIKGDFVVETLPN